MFKPELTVKKPVYIGHQASGPEKSPVCLLVHKQEGKRPQSVSVFHSSGIPFPSGPSEAVLGISVDLALHSMDTRPRPDTLSLINPLERKQVSGQKARFLPGICLVYTENVQKGKNNSLMRKGLGRELKVNTPGLDPHLPPKRQGFAKETNMIQHT